jgi:hypothetical protein
MCISFGKSGRREGSMTFLQVETTRHLYDSSTFLINRLAAIEAYCPTKTTSKDLLSLN